MLPSVIGADGGSRGGIGAFVARGVGKCKARPPTRRHLMELDELITDQAEAERYAKTAREMYVRGAGIKRKR